MFNLKLLFTFAFCCFSLASSNPVEKQSKYHSCQQFNTPRPLITCVDVSSKNNQLIAHFTVGPYTLFDQNLGSSNGENCANTLGLNVCLNWTFNQKNVCFQAIATSLSDPDYKLNVDLGCSIN